MALPSMERSASPPPTNPLPGSLTTTVMPIQSVTEENRAIRRHSRNVRRATGRIRLRAICRQPQAAVSSPHPVVPDLPSVRPPEVGA